MKNTFKKIFGMEDKTPDTPDQQDFENSPEQAETSESKAENKSESGKLKELQQQLEESRNKYLYLFSDFENFRRNAARERLDLMQTAGRDIMTAMLPILDDFDRAERNNALTEGVALIHHKMQHTVESKGLRKLTTQAGDIFNPDLHEAVAEIPAASEDLKGKIVDILEQGYSLGDRIIRFAKVVVGR